MTTLYDRDAFERAHVRLRSAPGELAMADIAQLMAFSPDLAREALAARNAALFPAVPPPAQASATKSGLSAQATDTIAEGVVTFVKQQLTPILTRLDALEQQSPSPRYEGTFQDGKAYARGSLTTQSGGLWLALDNTTQRPGRSDQWKLIVKSGEAR